MKTVVWEPTRHHLIQREPLRHLIGRTGLTVCGLALEKARGKKSSMPPTCPACISRKADGREAEVRKSKKKEKK